MAGYVTNLEEATQKNVNFRTVLYTAEHSQLVVMSLKPGEEIGMEVHLNIDQFIRVESGTGKVIMNGEENAISDGFAFVIPAGTNHNVINTGDTQMKLYTVYTPPNHKDGTVHITKADAEAAELLEHAA
ncbi:cupin domain-containing protein [Candidatus Falkowbacteria bacterium CG10_big_fil_rev_8_21_14_0_10_43_11]|uniref:Cupin domain-containing protein n=1 Tax=Candidatus Falkowbacteria bacterium CG10_big_fil_rev_8_21_14_0_10_43_11 TaxID=1974568 RepID=A0A2M6WMN8_9BACT|nr:MAG: cupin domain-containing protein [Candidatus Falkowbacteria bacterium CG10_big_fil_rev_8_21_14_0_10_43_11]